MKTSAPERFPFLDKCSKCLHILNTFYLSVQRTVIAQMIPVSIAYQFCKNKFVNKMIIYVNFNFVIMLTIIMMIMSVCVLHSDIFSTARVCVENVIQEWKTFTFS